MAFKLKGHSLPGPHQNKTPGPYHKNKEVGDTSDRDDVSKKFRHDTTNETNSRGSNIQIDSFARGGQYNTKPKTIKKDGVTSFVDKDEDGVVDQKKDGNTTRGRTVTIGKKTTDDGDVKYVRDAQRVGRDGKLKTGIFKPKEISEARYNRIMNRKTKKQKRKDEKHSKKGGTNTHTNSAQF
jgi:hypothetical protein|tara:strand:+ start:929 stop:1471 length:543 start_codon:yes stop_codon:yes gene_type:complete